MFPGFSTGEVLHEALVAPRSAIVPLPDTRIIERPGWWQILTPSLTRGGMNEIICDALPEGDAGAIIDEAIEQYRSLGLLFRWTIHPWTTPPDLGDRLARRGLVRSSSFAMARLTAGAGPADEGPITVEHVDLTNVDEFTRVMAGGWESDPAQLHPLHLRMLSDPANRNQLFLARYEGAAAAVGCYIALGRSAYLIGAVVLSPHRGRGLYRALVNARMRHASTRGIELATSVAMADTSAPVLARLGFERACEVTAYSNG